MNRYPNGHIRTLRLYIGAFASRFAQAVAYGILHLQPCKLSVAQSIVGTTCSNGNSGAIADHRCPRQCLYAIIERFGAIGLNTTHNAQNARSNARPQAHTVAFHLRSEKSDTALQGAHALSAQTLQFVGKNMLKPLRARSKKLKLSVVHKGLLALKVLSEFDSTASPGDK